MIGARAGHAPLWAVILFALLGLAGGVAAGAYFLGLANSAMNSNRWRLYMTISMLPCIIVQFATAGITLGLAKLLF